MQFRIPPYFALIIRAISVLEGIALVGNPDFALVDEAYPYISKRLLTDDSPRLREALRYMVYGKSGIFDADRLIDLLGALEDYGVASTSARGEMDSIGASPAASLGGGRAGGFTSTMPDDSSSSSGRRAASPGGFSFPFPGFPFPGSSDSWQADGLGSLVPASAFFNQMVQMSPFSQALGLVPALAGGGGGGSSWPSAGGGGDSQTREALKFIVSPQGVWFREFVLDEVVKSVDALSREQLLMLVQQLGLQAVSLPVFLPGEAVQHMPHAV